MNVDQSPTKTKAKSMNRQMNKRPKLGKSPTKKGDGEGKDK